MGGMKAGDWEDERSVKNGGLWGRNLCPNFLQYFLEVIYREGRSGGDRKLIPIFDDLPFWRRLGLCSTFEE